jgi:hypothetical protein
MMGRGCALLLVLALIVIVLVAAALIYMQSQTNDIRVQVTAPAQVAANDEFSVEVLIENVSLEPVTVTGISIDRSFLEGAEVVQTEPTYRTAGESSYPILGSWDEYSFGTEIPAGGRLVLTFMLRAESEPGVYSGELGVWVDTDSLIPINRSRREVVEVEVQ